MELCGIHQRSNSAAKELFVLTRGNGGGKENRSVKMICLIGQYGI